MWKQTNKHTPPKKAQRNQTKPNQTKKHLSKKKKEKKGDLSPLATKLLSWPWKKKYLYSQKMEEGAERKRGGKKKKK